MKKNNNSGTEINKSSLPKYVIEVSEEQARIISLALDIYSRMEGGQLEWAFSMIQWKYPDNLEAADLLLKELQLLLTGKDRGNLGIGNVSNSARMAYDLHQVIRHRLSWDNEPSGGMAVHFNPPMQWGDQPLAKIEHSTKK